MLQFIHAAGLLKLAVLVPVHACTQQISFWCLYVVCTHSSILFVVPIKLDKRTSGLYRVWYLLQTHVNSTVTLELRPEVSERLNMKEYGTNKMNAYHSLFPSDVTHLLKDSQKGFQGFHFHQIRHSPMMPSRFLPNNKLGSEHDHRGLGSSCRDTLPLFLNGCLGQCR
jgi:hypothetical protein